MKIVMVSRHCCIRVQKMAIPLIERGHDVHLIAMRVPSFWEQYKSFLLCSDIEQMLESFKLHLKDADLFHCHNEPSWFVTGLKEMTDIPVILDVHDSYLARSTPDEATEALDDGKNHLRVMAEERNNFQLADALIFPGDDFRWVVTSEFKLTQPALTLQSLVPQRYYRYQAPQWHGGLVYEGKVNLPSETDGPHSGFSYCEYTELASQASEIGMDLHFYANRKDDKFRKHYTDRAFIHPPQSFDRLLDSLGCHDWGLVGNTHPTPEWKVAMPNKLFEYMASAVPVVAMHADNCARFVEENGVGIVVDGVSELAERWSEHRACRANVIRERKHWSMNNHIHRLEAFYREVVNESR